MPRLRLLALMLGAILLVAGVFAAGVATAPLVQPPPPRADQPDAVKDQFEVFWEAWNMVDDHFVDRQALDAKKRTYGAIQGMLDSLGDIGHTRFLTPDDLKQERDALAGKFEGIGAEINMRDGRVIIVAPLDGSPAERAGVQAGDIVVAVNGQSTAHLTLQEVIRLIRGPKGSEVTLTIIHSGETVEMKVTVVRDEIKVSSVVSNYLPERKVGHVRIAQFGQAANQELVAALRALRGQGAKAYVIDVRNDPGGFLDQAVAVTSQFLKSGAVLLEQDSNGNRRAYDVRGGGIATDVPIAVLINRGTASAAEIFAGAIKDHGRGPVLGEQSFGTGTVLASFNLSDGSAMLLATAEWLTPNGRLIKNEGIEPDTVVQQAPDAEPISPSAERAMTEEEILRADAQLRAAVEAVTAALTPAPAGSPR